ncbi:MAG TPA: DegV family protein [Firmicutes bacterium]|nr:DegV family protein [Bacillota bacterium]
MNNIAIVTDSTAYLSTREREEHGITVVPLTVNFEDGFLYNEIVNNKELFERIGRAKKLPFTSQPAAGQFEEIYGALVEAGREVISLHVSSGLSGTFESAARAAAAIAPDRITVFDSLTTSAPLAFLVLAAAQWAEEGLARAAIAARLERARGELGSFLIPDTLEYIKKGGRIGGAQALLGSLLQVKPILYFASGKVEVLAKVRTRRKAIRRMLAELPRQGKNLQVAVVHCAAPGEAVAVKEMILEKAPHQAVEIRELGPVLSIHGGPGLVGMGFWARS